MARYRYQDLKWAGVLHNLRGPEAERCGLSARVKSVVMAPNVCMAASIFEKHLGIHASKLSAVNSIRVAEMLCLRFLPSFIIATHQISTI